MLKQFDLVWNGTLGEIKTVRPHIDLFPNARTAMSLPYRGDPAARKEIHREVQSMRDQDVIKPAQSEWASLVVLAPKFDGSYRLYSNYW